MTQELPPMPAIDPSLALIHELSGPITALLFELDRMAGSCRALGATAGATAAATADAPATAAGGGDRGGVIAQLESQLARARARAIHVQAVVHDFRGALTGGRAPRQLERCDLRAAVSQAIAMASPVLRERCHVSVRLGEVPALVTATETRLVQVVRNLLDNAGESVPSGNRVYNEISVRVAVDARDVRLEIADTGCGIPRQHLARIFEIGFTTKSGGGNGGLGLPLVRALVESFGGYLEVDSTLGLGTRVLVCLPRAADAADAAEAAPAPALAVASRGGPR